MVDLVVVGLVAPAHRIEDIEVEVLKGVEMTIPASVWRLSKDLHEALQNRQIAVLRSTASRPSEVLEDTTVLKAEVARLTLQNQALLERNVVLEAQVEYLQQGLAALNEKLETSMTPPVEETSEGGSSSQVKAKPFRQGGKG